jgi:hypothetical protein
MRAADKAKARDCSPSLPVIAVIERWSALRTIA